MNLGGMYSRVNGFCSNLDTKNEISEFVKLYTGLNFVR